MPFIGRRQPGGSQKAQLFDDEEQQRETEERRNQGGQQRADDARVDRSRQAAVDAAQARHRDRRESGDPGGRLAAARAERSGRGGDSTGGSSQGGTTSKWDEFLDPQSAAWLRGLFGPTDTSAQEDMARQQSEAALGRGKANLEARGGMGGMGLMGGQIAMGADLERQSATDLANQILGIQDQAAQRDLQRGTVAAEFLDRGVGRGLQAQEIGKDDAMTFAILAEMGLKPVFDDEGNLTGFDDVGQEGVDPRLTDDDPTNDAEARADEAKGFEEQFADVPEEFFNFTDLTGEEEQATWTRDDGSTVTVYQREDGSLFKIVR